MEALEQTIEDLKQVAAEVSCEEQLRERIESDPQLVSKCLSWAIPQLFRLTRPRTAKCVPSEPSDETRRAYIAVAERRWMEHPLSSGMRLKEARKPDLLAECDFLQEMIQEQAWEIGWLRAIADKLPAKSTKVKDILTEEQLVALQPRRTQAA